MIADQRDAEHDERAERPSARCGPPARGAAPPESAGPRASPATSTSPRSQSRESVLGALHQAARTAMISGDDRRPVGVRRVVVARRLRRRCRDRSRRRSPSAAVPCARSRPRRARSSSSAGSSTWPSDGPFTPMRRNIATNARNGGEPPHDTLQPAHRDAEQRRAVGVLGVARSATPIALNRKNAVRPRRMSGDDDERQHVVAEELRARRARPDREVEVDERRELHGARVADPDREQRARARRGAG